MMRAWVGVLLLMASASGAGADPLARGVGADVTCANYLVEVANKTPTGSSLQQWVLGFMTGYMARLALTDDDPTTKIGN